MIYVDLEQLRGKTLKAIEIYKNPGNRSYTIKLVTTENMRYYIPNVQGCYELVPFVNHSPCEGLTVK